MVASHNIDNLILYGFDPFPIIITMPYISIAMFWKKLPSVATILILGIFTAIEMNHTITGHIPTLIENGLNRKTFSALLFDCGLLFWVAIIGLLVKNIVLSFLQRANQSNSIQNK
ncbi:hypothetical protein P5G62_010800 [Neobacillus sp. 179-C4.2 HS]|uniref:Uncharacterized protein n=1 Tax=Neobacillus driksii TaxID=3035913 RepID=A0ABV4YRV4_9BACI|nr:hypothetical protein [Neobacillus sp. 179.-C4.2 HS]